MGKISSIPKFGNITSIVKKYNLVSSSQGLGKLNYEIKCKYYLKKIIKIIFGFNDIIVLTQIVLCAPVRRLYADINNQSSNKSQS